MNNNLGKSQNAKIKFFAIFKLINSIIYFIPSYLCIVFGLTTAMLYLILGNGRSEITNTTGIIDSIILLLISLMPTILTVILFIFTLIYTILVFRKKYNKIIDLITSILLLIINILLLIFLFKLSSYVLIILFLILSIIITANIIFTIILLVNNKKIIKIFINFKKTTYYLIGEFYGNTISKI